MPDNPRNHAVLSIGYQNCLFVRLTRLPPVIPSLPNRDLGVLVESYRVVRKTNRCCCLRVA